MGDQLGGTGQILPLHVFWTCHAGSRRSASLVQCRVARCDMGLPTPHLSFHLASFGGPQSGAVTETQFLIGLRVLCGLLCSALSTLHWVPVGDGFREAKRDASRPWTSRNLRARHSQSSGLPTPRPLWLRLRRVVSLSAWVLESSSQGSLLHF